MFMKIKKISKNTFIVAQGWFSAFNSITCGQVKTRLLESQAESKELNLSQSVGMCIVIGFSFR